MSVLHWTATNLHEVKQETLSGLERNDPQLSSCDICLGCGEIVAWWCTPGDPQPSDSLPTVLCIQFSFFGIGNPVLIQGNISCWWWKLHIPRKKQVVWGKCYHLVRKKNFLEYFLAVPFLPSFHIFSRCCLFKEQNGAERKGKKWLNVSGKESKGLWMGQSHHTTMRAEHQDPTGWEFSGLRLLLPFFVVFPSKPGVCVPCGFHLWGIYHW